MRLPHTDHLNEEQYRFAEAVVEDPRQSPGVLLRATAGSGKTTSLVATVAALVTTGTDSRDIVCSTFTRDAGKEMEGRLRKVVPAALEGLRVGTFHRLGLLSLREIAPSAWDLSKCVSISSGIGTATAIRPGKTPDVVPSTLQIWSAIVDWSRDGVPGTGEASLKLSDCGQPTDYAAAVGLLRAQGLTLLDRKGKLDKVAEKEAKRLGSRLGLRKLEKAWLAYAQSLRALDAWDFDGLLCAWHDLLVYDAHEGRLQPAAHVFVDEAQDNNLVQLQIAMLLAGRHRAWKGERGRLYLVGDPRQRIYEWRGASDRLLAIVDRLKLEELTLDLNYRSGQKIVDVANRSMASMPSRVAGSAAKAARDSVGHLEILLAEDTIDEGKEVARRISELAKEGASFDDIAILVRTNAAAASFEGACMGEGIPTWRKGSQPFFERRDVLAYLAYAIVHTLLQWETSDEPFEASAYARPFRRLANTPKRYLSRGFLDDVVGLLDRGVYLREAIVKAAASRDVKPFTRRRARELVEWLSSFSRRGWPHATRMISDVIMSGLPKAEDPNSDEDRKAIPQICAQLARDHDRGLDFALHAERTAQNTAKTRQRPSHPVVTISTVHRFKGLEADHVFLSLPDRVFPHRRSVTEEQIAEEIRLAYVAFTRARESLIVSAPRGSTAGRHDVGLSVLGDPVRDALESR